MSKNIHIVGSGINSLTAAAILSKAGHQLTIHERNDWLGGCIRTETLEVPGFKHDIFSGFHPLFTTSPSYQELKADLEKHGLKYLNTDHVTGVLLPDGRSAVLHNNREDTIIALNKIQAGEGDAYRKAMEAFDQQADSVFGLLNSELWSWQGAKVGLKTWWQLGVNGLLEFLGEALPNARKWLDNTFQNDLTKALIAPWVLHTGLGPDDQASSLMNRVILASFEQTGMPVPQGGGHELVKALVGIITANGGQCHTEHDVEQILVDGDTVKGLRVNGKEIEADIVLANVSPTALYRQLLTQDHVPQDISEEVDAYRYGRANMQMHLSLSEPPAWPTEALRKTAMVHVTPGMNGVSRAVNAAIRGQLPAEATIVVGQHCALDPSRAPEGKWTLWIQLQELPAQPQGDEAGEIECDGKWTPTIAKAYADRIIDRLQQQIPNLKDSILERNIISPAELERLNPNLVGGDPYCGAASLDQFLFWRPLPQLRGHETPVTNLYHIGASTHPGPGLAGTSGYLVAKQIG